MNFYPDQIFHVYNQGNNRQQVFFSDENYRYFEWKMKAYLLPFADIVAYCLMPNHFHFLIYVIKTEIERSVLNDHAAKTENERRISRYGDAAILSLNKPQLKKKENLLITLNESIGILQRSYTRAINMERNWSGSLFRGDCKSKDGWIDEFITLKHNGQHDSRFTYGNNFAFNCMVYIHNNPVVAGIVKKDIDWAYSSARAYAGLENDHFCNLEIGSRVKG